MVKRACATGFHSRKRGNKGNLINEIRVALSSRGDSPLPTAYDAPENPSETEAEDSFVFDGVPYEKPEDYLS